VSFPRYPKYKDSGVVWLGEVPETWTVCALSHRYQVALGKMLDEKNITGQHLAPYLRNTDVQWGTVNVVDLPQMDFKGDDLPRYSLNRGDLLVCEGGEVGRAAIWEAPLEECYYQKALHRIRPLDPGRESVQFLYFLFRAAAAVGAFTSSGEKATIAHLPAESLRRHRFPFPPRLEQVRIAEFLARETGKIDELVAEQQRLMGLLKEKRQAVISHAVTKGLNPHAPMKPSGIEWLGNVPEHWELRNFKHAVRSIEQGWSPQCEGFPAEGTEWGILKVGSVNGGTFNSSENKLLPPDMEPEPMLAIARDDLLISRANTRELVGSAAVAERDYPTLMICDKLYRIRFQPNTCSPRFVSHYLGSGAVRGQIELGATGASSSMLNIGQSTILDLAIAMPPFQEQLDIVGFIATETMTLDVLTAEAQKAIDLLQERRTALISAAVTGQIDVRELAAS